MISNWQLSFGEWWLLNRVALSRAGLQAGRGIFWISFALVAGIWGWYGYQVLTSVQGDRGMPSFAPIPEETLAKREPKQVELGGAVVNQSFGGGSVATLRITNPNDKMLARISLAFSFDGAARPPREIVLMPGQSRYAFDLAPGRASAVSAQVESVSWRRIAESARWPVSFAVSELNVLPFETENSAQSVSVPRGYVTEFSYRYEGSSPLRNAPAVVTVTRAGVPVASQNFIVPAVAPGTTLRTRLSWPYDLAGDVKIEMNPAFSAFEREYFGT